MEGDLHGVRILPPLVEFRDSEVNVVHKLNITVKNVGKTSKEIRYYGPQTQYFTLKVKNPEKPVAPGLEVPAIIEFTNTDPIVRKDRLIVTVDGNVIELPLCGYPCQPMLVLEGPVNFGNVVANSKVIAKEVTLYNHGSKEGEFKLKYSGDKPIAVIPSSGKVPANSAQIIKVEYVTKKPGKFKEVAKIKLEGKETEILQIEGCVVEGGLELLSYHTDEPMNCVKFGSTYYATDKTEMATLYNNGPEPVCFVSILDEDAIGQEVGVDLSKSISAGLANKGQSTEPITGQTNPLTSLVTAIPNQGMLAPYEKIPIFFRFSPRWNGSPQGFKCSQKPPPRKDFALFMNIKVVGASNGFQTNGDSTKKSNVEGSVLEIALTGTALPVLVSLSPQSRYDFGECPVGEHVDALCTVSNQSSSMPVSYKFRRVAHFTASPPTGKISPQQSQDIIFSFAPNQVGTFKPTQYIDVIGQVADNKNPFVMHLEIIHSVPVSFLGRSDPVTIKKEPVFNPGITPKISHEVGMYVDTSVAGSGKTPQVALLNSQGTKLHRLKNGKDGDENTLMAFPNDRAGSIRPSERHLSFKTPFTRTERHNYVDPDYAYTDEEAEQVKSHKQSYISYVGDMGDKRSNKIKSREFREHNTDADLAMKPAAGLRPKKLCIEEIVPDPKPPTPPNANWRLLSTKELADKEFSSTQKAIDGLNAVPTTKLEQADCQRVLSPQQLHQVIIGPPTVDFGQVCLKSISQKDLSIVNNLDQYIHVVVHVDCRELRQTSPLSQVVPPCAKATLPLIFESNTRGRFQRSLDYTINGFYKNHVTVFSEVVPVALQLSTDELVVEPQVGLPADAGIRGVVTLKNKLNYSAEFTWSPILGERGTAFSIRPATGTVEPFTELDCEVVFHPSYIAPEDGSFNLQVHGGEPLKLKCRANIGATNVQFLDKRIMFGQVPLHMTTTRTAMLKNTSLNHAYFQVLDPNPFPGLTVSPIHGVVPVGGNAELKISLTPNAVIKFDTRVNVAVRGWKTVELRMGGTVEPPVVDIDLPTFNLGGVYCGSSSTTAFKLINKANTGARIEFDLSRYADFALEFPGKQTSEDYSFQLMNPGISTVSMDSGEVIHANLIFKPLEVASYDFVVPVTINQTGAPTPSSTPFPPTPAPSNKNSLQHIINPRPVHVTIATPRRKVVATALRQPLQLSHNLVEFNLTPAVHELASASGIGQSKGTLLVNNSDQELRWEVDVTQGNQILEEGVFKFLHPSGMPFMTHGDKGVEGCLEPGQTQQLGVIFCPEKPGHYEVCLPIYVHGDHSRPYQHLTLVGELKAPRMWFDPLAIVLTPVPLETEISAEFQLFASNYVKRSSVKAEVPEVECEDGSTISPLTVQFLESSDIKACCGDAGQPEMITLACRVTFKSTKPVSFSEAVLFVDDMGNRFALPVTATADNCLLTCYPFLAQHRTDHQIVCEQGVTLKGRRTASRESVNVGEAVLVPCEDPLRSSSRPSTTATSSNFEVSSSSYEDSSQSVTESTYPSTPREGAVNKIQAQSADQRSGGERAGLQSRSLGSALFPEEDTEEGIFHTEVLLAAQRWFSSQGWPGGPNPVTIPENFRGGISKKPNEGKARNAKGNTWESTSMKKEIKTVYDMISHLCGKHVPGIPINNPLPRDPIERAKQVYWQHSTLLTFMRTQGACVASIKPEYLMELGEYKAWVKLQKEMEAKRNRSGRWEIKAKTEEEEAIEDQLFEAVSKRAWTDVLLQLLKTLMLAKITPRQFKNLPSPYKNANMPMVDPNPLCSNVYGMAERIVLLWLNYHYEQQRGKIWENCPKGGVPASRWVVNFDFDLLDGLVLGAVLGAHVPFLAKTHLCGMYTRPATAEQCLHNALKVVNAMRAIGLDYDIAAIDITDPNPISLLLLCVQLYFALPQYISKSTVEFIGALHDRVLRQVRLSNPSTKSLTYHAMLQGKDARHFALPRGDTVVIPPKSTINLPLEFVSHYLRSAEAVLVLVGRRQGSNVGTTLVFTLRSTIDSIKPLNTLKVESPCYELNKISVEISNPFPEAGTFRILLVESKGDILGSQESLNGGKRKKTKKVKSRINHGQTKSSSPIKEDSEETAAVLPVQPELIKQEDDDSLNAFYTNDSTIYLEANGQAELALNFLPFQVGKRQCSIIFACDDVGEFIFSVEANATLPKPAALPFQPSEHSVRISSAAAAGSTRGMFGGDESIVYWKCECGRTLKEKLVIPTANSAREAALVTAAQMQMSETELHRRKVTGSLQNGSVTNKAIKMLSSSGGKSLKSSKTNMSGTTFKVELDSKFFSAPNTLFVPNPVHKSGSSDNKVSDDKGVELFISFMTKEAGHYPCTVTLRSDEDVRVYYIECTVIPEGSEAQIEFTSPVHQAVTQNIPIINQTNHDWPLCASLTGDGFAGPNSIVAKARQTTHYQLLFRPHHEGEVRGKLILTNTEDGVDHTFHLSGVGEKPLPLETLTLKCQAKQRVTQMLPVPNVTKRKLHYRVESDLSCLSGAANITVLPGQTGQYEIVVQPLKRGHFKGILTFVAGDNPVKSPQPITKFTNDGVLEEVDSDGDEVDDNECDPILQGYRVWYSVDIEVSPPAPERTLEITCACQKRVILEVGVNNPVGQALALEASVKGLGLSGPSTIELPAHGRAVYELVYFPAIVGESKGSLVFYHELVGEFWYELELTAEKPQPTTLAHMECELGRWVRQTITLSNPTEETLDLIPMVSNTNNFVLDRDSDLPIELRPHSNLKIPITFMPSTLGKGDHSATITFHCQQLGEWVYHVAGTGLLPNPQDPVSITSAAGSNSTLIIPFRNPLDTTIFANVHLIDVNQRDKEALKLDTPDKLDSPFCLLLKHNQGIRLGPKSTIDIPVSFAPEDMKMFEAEIVVVVTREDNDKWVYVATDPLKNPSGAAGWELDEIRWVYPIHGYPELTAGQETPPAVVECQARDRIEERLEVTLSGVAPSSGGPKRGIKARAITPANENAESPEGVVVAESIALAEEFTYEIVYVEQDSQKNLESSIALQLVRQQRDKQTGQVVLVFNIVYAPYKPMTYDVQLLVKGATGGLWRFPIKFVATEPEPDDTIVIEAAGLNKLSSLGFRINSQTKHPVNYNAYFVAGSDVEFAVSPAKGELLPVGTNGTLIKINFTPSKYGKIYHGKLVIQSSDMQWTYNVRGVLPDYIPPRGMSSRPMAGPHPDPRQRHDKVSYIRDNLGLTTTGVSSPLKGAPILRRSMKPQSIQY